MSKILNNVTKKFKAAIGKLGFGAQQKNVEPEQTAEQKAVADKTRREEYFCGMIKEYIFDHPAAASTAGFANIVRSGIPEHNAPLALGQALLGMGDLLERLDKQFACFDEKDVVIAEDGSFAIAGQKRANDIINAIVGVLACTESQAQDIWKWVYTLAGSGEAEHILPCFLVEPKDKTVVVKKDPAFEGKERNASSWAQTQMNWCRDRNEARKKIVAVPEALPAAKPPAPKQ